MNVNDRIEKQMKISAPVSQVWKALTDFQEFGSWFQVKFDRPFAINHISCGQITYPGYEQHTIAITVQQMEPERLFSFSWHPYAVDLSRNYSEEIQTCVAFCLKTIPQGTFVFLTESGFDHLPPDRRLEAFHMNDKGWTEQMNNLKNFVER